MECIVVIGVFDVGRTTGLYSAFIWYWHMVEWYIRQSFS